MLRIVTAVIVTIALFITGWWQLSVIKNSYKSLSPYTVFDYEPQCNDTTYLDNGNSESDIIAHADKSDVIIDEMELLLLDYDTKFLTIGNKETLHSILRPAKVSEQEIASLSSAFRPHLLAKDLAVGDFYRFDLQAIDDNNSIVKEFVIRKLDPNRLPILYRAQRITKELNDPRFKVEIREPKITEQVAVIHMQVLQTLYQTFNALPFGNELMQRLMEIFTWELRMPEDINKGDEIELVVIKKYALGNFIGYGKIRSVFYRQKHRTLFATFFSSKDKKIQGFFNEDGKSLEKEFAHSPVYETTATSDQKWRVHPIRKIRIRHNGVDYRGVIGTEFFSIADGEVVEKRYDQNVGNMIRIKHNYGVHSEYFHADNLVESLVVGSRVKRGQKLGTIGRTGKLCTGPHLHMGLYRLDGKKRKFIELVSLKRLLKAAPGIDIAHKNEFKEHVKSMVALMVRPTEQFADTLQRRDSVAAKKSMDF